MAKIHKRMDMNPRFSKARQDELDAYLAGRTEMLIDFDDIRANVSSLSTYKDGEIHQLAINAGHVVDLEIPISIPNPAPE